MNSIKCLFVLFLVLSFISCEKSETITVADLIQNEKGWYCTAYKRVDIGIEGTFKSNQPYIILGEYGSGFKINQDGTYYVGYSDGSVSIEEESILRNWIIEGDNTITFNNHSTVDIVATIVEISSDFLWIKYESIGDNWEYKLEKID